MVPRTTNPCHLGRSQATNEAHGRAISNSAISRMMNMNTLGMRFYRASTLRCVASTAWVIGFGTLAIGQGVAPPTSGYGNQVSPPANQQRPGNQPGAGQAGAGQAGVGQPGAGPVSGNPNTGRVAPGQGNVKGQAQGFAPQGNPAMNPALNPAFNQRPVSNQIPKTGSGQEVVTMDPFAKTPPSPQEQADLDKVLNYWERSTADIERYSCKFLRWQYNSSDNFVAELAQKLGRNIREVNVTTASGELKYMAPDKGMFKIDMLLKLTGQLDAKSQPEYKNFNGIFGEWWLCDGERVYEYDRSNKRCTRFTMPPELKGAGILESPMPFMFGVKAEKIKARYWVRLLPAPKDAQGRQRDDLFLLEAHPKFQADAVNYHHVQIFLDREMFLPVMLIKYNPEHVDEPNEVLKDNREVFQFSDRAKNASLLQKINDVIFRNEFIPFDVKDWNVEDRVFAPPAMDNVRAASNPDGPQPNNAPIVRK